MARIPSTRLCWRTPWAWRCWWSSRQDFGPEGGSRELRGAAAVAGQALGYARAGLDIRPALINGAAGAVAFRDGQPFSIGAVTVRNGRIIELDFLADRKRLPELD
jgi:RNA polymerase sigma-70 factor (ECF subfamily)